MFQSVVRKGDQVVVSGVRRHDVIGEGFVYPAVTVTVRVVRRSHFVVGYKAFADDEKVRRVVRRRGHIHAAKIKGRTVTVHIVNVLFSEFGTFGKYGFGYSFYIVAGRSEGGKTFKILAYAFQPVVSGDELGVFRFFGFV